MNIFQAFLYNRSNRVGGNFGGQGRSEVLPNEVGKTLIRRRPKFPPTVKVKTEDGVRGTLALPE